MTKTADKTYTFSTDQKRLLAIKEVDTTKTAFTLAVGASNAITLDGNAIKTFATKKDGKAKNENGKVIVAALLLEFNPFDS